MLVGGQPVSFWAPAGTRTTEGGMQRYRLADGLVATLGDPQPVETGVCEHSISAVPEWVEITGVCAKLRLQFVIQLTSSMVSA